MSQCSIDSSSEPMEPAVSQEVVDAAVDAALAVTLALPARTKAYLKQCSPSVLAQMASSLAALKVGCSSQLKQGREPIVGCA